MIKMMVCIFYKDAKMTEMLRIGMKHPQKKLGKTAHARGIVERVGSDRGGYWKVHIIK